MYDLSVRDPGMNGFADHWLTILHNPEAAAWIAVD